jgi:hypothetical protein
MAKETNMFQDQNIVAKAKSIYKKKGLLGVIVATSRLIILYLSSLFWYPYIHLRGNKFQFQGRQYEYFFHFYNLTWRNERTVEIPIARQIVKEWRGKQILEVGNVLSHYISFEHDIVDKYERGKGVINQDIVDFRPNHKYDLIVSISTLEHVGWDEVPRENRKIFKAIRNLRESLSSGGKMFITLPLGQNKELDDLLERGELRFPEQYYLAKVSRTNKWQQTDWARAKESSAKYQNGAVVICVLDNN